MFVVLDLDGGRPTAFWAIEDDRAVPRDVGSGER